MVERLVLIGTNFHHDGIYPLEIDPDSAVLAGLVEAYAARTPDGAEHFGEMAGKFMAMAATEPALTIDDLARISAPTLVMSGDDDLVKLSHTVELYETLPVAQLAIVPPLGGEQWETARHSGDLARALIRVFDLIRP